MLRSGSEASHGLGDRISAATVDRIRATMRSVLNATVREGVLAANPMRSVKVSHPTRPHPVVWTDERIAELRRTGVRPPVAVWTLAQTARLVRSCRARNGCRSRPWRRKEHRLCINLLDFDKF
jgi:hypothetical protein